MVMTVKLNRLTHTIAIQLHLVAESCNICSSCFRRPVRKLSNTPSRARACVRVEIEVHTHETNNFNNSCRTEIPHVGNMLTIDSKNHTLKRSLSILTRLGHWAYDPTHAS